MPFCQFHCTATVRAVPASTRSLVHLFAFTLVLTFKPLNCPHTRYKWLLS